jgi:hypothetical protein
MLKLFSRLLLQVVLNNRKQYQRCVTVIVFACRTSSSTLLRSRSNVSTTDTLSSMKGSGNAAVTMLLAGAGLLLQVVHCRRSCALPRLQQQKHACGHTVKFVLLLSFKVVGAGSSG